MSGKRLTLLKPRDSQNRSTFENIEYNQENPEPAFTAAPFSLDFESFSEEVLGQKRERSFSNKEERKELKTQLLSVLAPTSEYENKCETRFRGLSEVDQQNLETFVSNSKAFATRAAQSFACKN